jgi:hypothetical protein
VSARDPLVIACQAGRSPLDLGEDQTGDGIDGRKLRNTCLKTIRIAVSRQDVRRTLREAWVQGSIARRLTVLPFANPHYQDTLSLYKKYTFYLYSESRYAEGKRLICRARAELASPRGFEPLLPP